MLNKYFNNDHVTKLSCSEISAAFLAANCVGYVSKCHPFYVRNVKQHSLALWVWILTVPLVWLLHYLHHKNHRKIRHNKMEEGSPELEFITHLAVGDAVRPNDCVGFQRARSHQATKHERTSFSDPRWPPLKLPPTEYGYLLSIRRHGVTWHVSLFTLLSPQRFVD